MPRPPSRHRTRGRGQSMRSSDIPSPGRKSRPSRKSLRHPTARRTGPQRNHLRPRLVKSGRPCLRGRGAGPPQSRGCLHLTARSRSVALRPPPTVQRQAAPITSRDRSQNGRPIIKERGEAVISARQATTGNDPKNNLRTPMEREISPRAERKAEQITTRTASIKEKAPTMPHERTAVHTPMSSILSTLRFQRFLPVLNQHIRISSFSAQLRRGRWSAEVPSRHHR